MTTHHLSSLYEKQAVNNIVPTESELQELVGMFQQIVQNAGALLHVNNCSLALVDAPQGMLVTRAALQKDGHKTRQTRFQLNEGVAGWVAEHRQPLIINDVDLDPRFKRLGREPVGSIMCVPLIDNGNFIGTLTASSAETGAFDEHTLQMLTIFAQQAVLAITNAHHAELARHQADQLEMLLGLSQDITTLLDVKTLYRTILTNVHRLVPCLHAVMYIFDGETQMLCPVAELLEAGTRRKSGAPVVLTSTEVRRERLYLHDEASIIAWAGVHRHPMVQTPHGEDDTAEIATPLVSKNTLYGVLSLQRPQPFMSEELRLVRNLCNMAASALENAALFQVVRVDQEQLRTILEASSDGVAVIGGGGSFVEANPAFGHIFGLHPEQLLGMEFSELFDTGEALSSETRSNLEKVSVALMNQQTLPNIEIDLNLKSVSRSVGLSVTPVAVASKPLCLVVARDVTAIRDANRVKANFLSMITHELRSPLNAIHGYLDLALNGIGGDLNEQHREFVQRARAGSEHLYALVEDLLFISRADSGQLRLSRDVMNLREVVDNAVEELELTAVDNDITIEIALPQGFPPVYADSVRIQQVLRNLINNALRFTPAGGSVTISASTIAESPADQASDDAGRMALVSVRDTGYGIASEYQQRVFERFYQVPAADTSGRSGGQGLGLAIVKMIVELHGGWVTVESAPGAGSVFSFTLPHLLS